MPPLAAAGEAIGSVVGDIFGGGASAASSLASDATQAASGFSNAFSSILGDATQGLSDAFGAGNGGSSYPGIGLEAAPPLPFSGGDSGASGLGSSGSPFDLGSIGPNLNDLQNQGTQLLQSSNPSDQLQGQQILQQEQQIFQAISKAISLQGEDAKTAVQNIQ
jgi:hypothetical protein